MFQVYYVKLNQAESEPFYVSTNVMSRSSVTFPSDRLTTDMYSGVPATAGNHVTGSDYEHVRVMSSMPTKKRIAVKYREMVARDSDSMLPTSVTETCQTEVSLPMEKNLDSSLRSGDRYVHYNQYDGIYRFSLKEL